MSMDPERPQPKSRTLRPYCQDVKLKIVQQEGYDAHDFNLFDDRSSQLWRKPYVDWRSAN